MTDRNLADAELTDAVLGRFEGTPDPRLKEVVSSLTRHLHAFVDEVQLTEDEWFAAIDFLTRTGHITDDKRQEFVLLSDVFGTSMQVIGINHRKPEGATESTVFGPFFVEGSPGFENGDDIAAGASGQPCYMGGTIKDLEGNPIGDALIEVWQADDEGFYDVQLADLDSPQGRGHLRSDQDGRYWFWSVLPEAYPIPTDGPVGDLLKATDRSPWRPAHVHFMVSAPGFETLTTHVFVDGDQYLDNDAVFGVKNQLIATFDKHDAGKAPDGTDVSSAFYTLDFDFVLAPEAD